MCSGTRGGKLLCSAQLSHLLTASYISWATMNSSCSHHVLHATYHTACACACSGDNNGSLAPLSSTLIFQCD